MSRLTKMIRSFRQPEPKCKAVAKPALVETNGEKVRDYEAKLPFAAIQHDGARVVYCTPNQITKWRVDTLFSKEPDTLEWIAGFQPGDVLVDIGANVGMYSIWASATRGTRVFAFEPESQNFALLNRNIVANKLGERVTAFCAALSDEQGYSLLHLSTFGTGEACHTFGADLDHRLQPRTSPYLQGCLSTTLDKLIASGIVPVPTHIKIDVDGIEHKVVAGCRETLRHPQLKSVLIEIDSTLSQHRPLVEEITALGFRFSDKQVQAARRTDGPATGTGNYIFRR